MGPAGSSSDSSARIEALSERKRALLAALRAQHAGGPSGAELLRPGAGPALVLVHPVGGEVLCYGELVRLLRGSYPVYGLAADQHLRGTTPPTIEEIVGSYLERIEGIKPALLAGWSFGGIVAYEMARSLAERGAPCPVAAIDSIPAHPNQARREPSQAELLEFFVFDLIRSTGADPLDVRLDPGLWRLPPREMVDLLQIDLEVQGIRPGLSTDELADRAQVYANAFAALEQHRARPDGPPVHLLWGTESATDPTPWWRDAARETLTAVSVTGDHYSLLRRPAVSRVAAFLDGVLETQPTEQNSTKGTG